MIIFRLIDYFIFSCTEYTKTLIRELYLLIFQFINFISILFLHVLYKPGHFTETATYDTSSKLENRTNKKKKSRFHSVVRNQIQKTTSSSSSSSPSAKKKKEIQLKIQ